MTPERRVESPATVRCTLNAQRTANPFPRLLLWLVLVLPTFLQAADYPPATLVSSVVGSFCTVERFTVQKLKVGSRPAIT